MAAKKSTAGNGEKAKRAGTSGKEGRKPDSIQQARKNTEPKIQYDNIPLHVPSEAERELMESRERLELVLESGEIGTWDWDVQNRRIRWNDKLYEILGLSPGVKEIAVETFFHYIHPKDLPRVQQNISQVMKSEEDFKDTFRVVREDGEIRWLSGRGRLFRDEQGRPVRMMGVNHDVTESKQAEESLRRAGELSAALNRINEAVHSALNPNEILQRLVTEGACVLESETAAVSVRRPDGWAIRYVYGMTEELVGVVMNDEQERHAVLALETAQPVAVTDTANDDRVNREHLLSYNIRSVLVVPLIARGRPVGAVFFNYHTASHRFADDEVNFARQLAATASIAIENARLFDERKRAAEALSLEREKLKNILDTIPDSVYIVGRDGTIEYVNPKMEKGKGPWAGKKCHQYRAGRDDPCPSCNFDEVQSGETVRSEWADERTGKIYDCIDAPLTNPDGSISKLKIMRDVTERRQAADKIERQNAVLEGINSILTEALTCETEEELGQVCLAVAEHVTESKIGFIGEIGPDGLLHDIAINNLGWELCTMCDKSGHRIPPGDFAVKGLYVRVLRKGKSFFTNDPASHPDGTGTPEGHPILTSFLGAPLLHKGRTIGIVAVANRQRGYDCRQRRALEAISATIVQVFSWFRAEGALRRSEERFHSLFSTMSEAFVLCELIRDDAGKVVDCRVLDANPAVEAMTGIRPDDAIGRNMLEIFPDTDNFWFETYGNVEATGEPVSFEHRFDPLNRVYYTSVYRPAPGLVAIIFMDLTERKQAEQELRRSNEELQRFNRVAVGRELRMIELKKEVNGLCTLTGQPQRYPLEFVKKNDIEKEQTQSP